jgi:hypothetical protein
MYVKPLNSGAAIRASTTETMPIELIRAGLLNVPLTRETKPSWKFAGANPSGK